MPAIYSTQIPVIFLLCLMSIIAIIDYRQQIIPNKLLLVGTIVGAVLNLAVDKLSLLEMIIGLTSGGAVLLVIAIISKGGMGGGDVKLAAMLGIYLGWEHTLQTILWAALLAALTGLVLMLAGKANRTTAIPFGPFLAISTFGLFLGQSLFYFWN